jgi:hypothetical protein
LNLFSILKPYLCKCILLFPSHQLFGFPSIASPEISQILYAFIIYPRSSIYTAKIPNVSSYSLQTLF